MKKEIELWTQQSETVKNKLFEQGRTTVKKRYIKNKYGLQAKIFLTAYDFFVNKAKDIIEKPADAEYPVWAACDRQTALSSSSGYLLKLLVPQDKVIIFDANKWNDILNLRYLPENEEEEKKHQEKLAKYGINSDIDIVLSPHYPKLNQEIKESWQRLFNDNLSDINKKRAALWELRSNWVEEVIEL